MDGLEGGRFLEALGGNFFNEYPVDRSVWKKFVIGLFVAIQNPIGGIPTIIHLMI
jgi:hypothetical protein